MNETGCRDWLLSLDNGHGALVQYLLALMTEFDGDLTQISSVWAEPREGQSLASCVDPEFWQVLGVRKAGHKLLFANGIAELNRQAG